MKLSMFYKRLLLGFVDDSTGDMLFLSLFSLFYSPWPLWVEIIRCTINCNSPAS